MKKKSLEKVHPNNSRYTAQKKYNTNNIKQIKFAFNINSDADILEKLKNEPNKQGYIKSLIRQDIAK